MTKEVLFTISEENLWKTKMLALYKRKEETDVLDDLLNKIDIIEVLSDMEKKKNILKQGNAIIGKNNEPDR